VLTRLLERWAFPALPIGFAVVFVVLPLALTIAVSFWTRVGLLVRPAFTFTSYEAFFAGARLLVLERSFLASIEATVLSLLLAYPIAYFLAFKVSPRAGAPSCCCSPCPFWSTTSSAPSPGPGCSAAPA
jgi:spermidine/putrescine transport system permease protein